MQSHVARLSLNEYDEFRKDKSLKVKVTVDVCTYTVFLSCLSFKPRIQSAKDLQSWVNGKGDEQYAIDQTRKAERHSE